MSSKVLLDVLFCDWNGKDSQRLVVSRQSSGKRIPVSWYR